MHIIDMPLTRNQYSRPGTRLKGVKGIVLHWIAAPNQKPENTRGFFENRKYGKTNYGSAHFIVGTDGKTIRCIPENEMAYHVGSTKYTSDALRRLSSYPNDCTIGIEMAHVDWDGRFSEETLEATALLVASLLRKYNLTTNDIWTHHSVVGWKDCPRWFVNNPKDLALFKRRVAGILNGKEEANTKEADDKLELIDSRRDYLVKILEEYARQGKISDIHAKQVKSGEMTVSNAVFLLYVLQFEGAKK